MVHMHGVFKVILLMSKIRNRLGRDLAGLSGTIGRVYQGRLHTTKKSEGYWQTRQ